MVFVVLVFVVVRPVLVLPAVVVLLLLLPVLLLVVVLLLPVFLPGVEAVVVDLDVAGPERVLLPAAAFVLLLALLLPVVFLVLLLDDLVCDVPVYVCRWYVSCAASDAYTSNVIPMSSFRVLITCTQPTKWIVSTSSMYILLNILKTGRHREDHLELCSHSRVTPQNVYVR